MCPYREAPTPKHHNRPITAWVTSMGLAHANCSSSAGVVHKLHINPSLEACSTPLEVQYSHSDWCTNSETPIKKNSHWLKRSHPHKSLSLRWIAEVVFHEEFFFRYKYRYKFYTDYGWICFILHISFNISFSPSFPVCFYAFPM